MYNILATAVKIDANGANVPKNGITAATVQGFFNATFVVIGAITVLFVIIGAIRYVLSAGDANSVTQAKNTILYALIGMGITIASFVIVQLVLGIF